jgi:hypothetical protein
MAFVESERVRLLPAEGPPLGKVIRPGGWREVISREDPGTGFYQFRVSELPLSIVGRGRTTSDFPVVEVFAENLEKARRMLALMSRGPSRSLQGGGAATVPEPPEVWPIAHRPTRLCKRARQARGE